MDYELMQNGIVKIGDVAPSFEAITTAGEIELEKYKGRWLVLFSYPGDFNALCTREIIEFELVSRRYNDICLLGLSIDSINSHYAWIGEIYKRTGIIINFPLIADRSSAIARKYGMISSNISNCETTRNTYIIDNKGIIRAILIYPKEIQRNIREIFKIIEELKLVC